MYVCMCKNAYVRMCVCVFVFVYVYTWLCAYMQKKETGFIIVTVCVDASSGSGGCHAGGDGDACRGVYLHAR